MQRSDWPEVLRQHLAIASVGNSTLMKQAGKGRVGRARKFLVSNLPLDGLAELNKAEFAKFLNAKTAILSRQLLRPEDNKPNWGAARKVINIFLRQCAMNKDLHPRFNLASTEPFLEVPLDGQIVMKIDERAGTTYAPTFRIKNLDKQLNRKIQESAMRLAVAEKMHRYELDVLFWNSDSHIKLPV